MTNFSKWDKEFRSQNLYAFNKSPNGVLWLKVRALCRCKQIRQFVKDKARANGIAFDREQTEAQQMYTIVEKLSELGLCDVLHELASKRKEVIDEARANPVELMTWLYANQGEMRFGSENRLYLILVDSKNISDSWKMKCAFSLIEPSVNQYLDGFNDNSLKETTFLFNGNQYKSLADIIFVIK